MAQFQEYPKLMKHPQHAAPVMKKMEGKGVGLFEPDTICTRPEKFPDVTVTDRNQEQYYAARGYRPTNMANSVEYEQAILESKPVDGYAFSDYPKWKYHAVEFPKIVKNVAEESALGDGWSDRPIIATEEDLEKEEAPAVNGHAVQSEVVADDAATAVTSKPAAKAKPKAKPKAKLIDKRTKAYKQAHA